MGDMGLAGGFGAGGAGDAMQTLFDQRMRAAQMAQQKEEFQQQQAQQDALTRLKFQEQAEATQARLEASKQAASDRADAAKAHALTVADAQLREMPTDQNISQPEVAGMVGQGILPSRFSPQPISAPAPPPGIAAPGDASGPQPMPGTVADAPAPNRVQFHRIPTAQELAAQSALKQKTEDAEWRIGIQQQIADAKAAGGGGKEHFADRPEIDPTSGAETGRYFGYNSATNKYELITGDTPRATKAPPGIAQTVQHNKDIHETLGNLDQLDAAIEAAKPYIGTGQGQLSDLKLFAGNANKAIDALGTKMLLAKMRVDHVASGTVRAGASPQLLKRWDNLLANKVDAEGLHASVQAMREIIGGAGPATGADVIYAKDPDGHVHQASPGTALPAGWVLMQRGGK